MFDQLIYSPWANSPSTVSALNKSVSNISVNNGLTPKTQEILAYILEATKVVGPQVLSYLLGRKAIKEGVPLGQVISNPAENIDVSAIDQKILDAISAAKAQTTGKDDKPPVADSRSAIDLKSPLFWGVVLGVVTVGAGAYYIGSSNKEAKPKRRYR
jgi:hypothetical protein